MSLEITDQRTNAIHAVVFLTERETRTAIGYVAQSARYVKTKSENSKKLNSKNNSKRSGWLNTKKKKSVYDAEMFSTVSTKKRSIAPFSVEETHIRQDEMQD